MLLLMRKNIVVSWAKQNGSHMELWSKKNKIKLIIDVEQNINNGCGAFDKFNFCLSNQAHKQIYFLINLQPVVENSPYFI